MAEDERGNDEGDPFAELTLDEEFVAGARVTEDSADARIERRRRIEAEHARLAHQREDQRRHDLRGSRRERRKRRLVLVAFFGALAGLFVWNYVKDTGGSGVALGSVPGFGADGSTRAVAGDARPPAGVDEHDVPLGRPASLAIESLAHAFIQLQSDDKTPVAYDPCRPIHVVVNSRTAPPGADALLAEALSATSIATGLQFIVDGPTDEAPSTDRSAYVPDRYPGRWAPVLVAWSDPAESSSLGGDVAGLGGSSPLSTDDGTVYVSGSIELDGPQMAQLAAGLGGTASARAVIEHELGHVVGLDHVDDPSQLMNPSGDGSVTGFAAGDLTGLARLGTGRCFPRV